MEMQLWTSGLFSVTRRIWGVGKERRVERGDVSVGGGWGDILFSGEDGGGGFCFGRWGGEDGRWCVEEEGVNFSVYTNFTAV